MYRTFTDKKGRRMRVPTAKAKKWFEDTAFVIKDAVRRQRWATLDEKCVVDLRVWWPDRRLRDCDNLNKCLMDTLTKNSVVTDDHFCLPRWQDYDYDKHNPRVEVIVWKHGHLTTEASTTNGTAS